VTKYINSHHTQINTSGLVGMYKEMLERGLIAKGGSAYNRYKKLEDRQSSFNKWKRLPRAIRNQIQGAKTIKSSTTNRSENE